MASRQSVTTATSCSIWPHEILAFTTSTFPSFYSSYILAHFQVFTVQSHATQLTTLCADQRGYMSNNSSLLFLSWIGSGGGSDVFVWVFLKGHTLIHSSNSEGHDFFRKKILKYPAPPPTPRTIKNVPSLISLPYHWLAWPAKIPEKLHVSTSLANVFLNGYINNRWP